VDWEDRCVFGKERDGVFHLWRVLIKEDVRRGHFGWVSSKGERD